MKICLFALTGFGNTVLEALIDNNTIDNIQVYTRKEKGKFPYYDCEQLSDICRKKGIDIYTDEKINYKNLKNFKPQMIFVATFHEKIPVEIINFPELGIINIHPSLLPYYRGATPTNWTIINGEKESGVTFHTMNNEFDMGDILFQQKISAKGLTDGELRQKLADLSGKMIEPFLSLYLRGEVKPIIQDKNKGSYYPKVMSKEGMYLLKSGKFERNNLIRGLTPYPGKEILENGI